MQYWGTLMILSVLIPRSATIIELTVHCVGPVSDDASKQTYTNTCTHTHANIHTHAHKHTL